MADRHSKRAAKRMRLGTKSCAECRRRKVRCVFTPGNTVCQGCALHNSPCISQQPNAKVNEPDCDRASLQQRVKDLEGLVKSLADSVCATTSVDEADADEATGQREPSQKARDEPPSTERFLAANNPSHAPLVNLFRDALLISDADGRLQDEDEASGCSAQARVGRGVLANLRPYIPNETMIRSIFTLTRIYWRTWPSCFYESEHGQTFQLNRGGEGEEYLIRVLSRQILDPSFCKCLLWLALCIQQLPVDWFRSNVTKVDSKQHLCTSYLAYCRIILANEDRDKLEAAQCDILSFKLYINMGMPQKAWACTRSAISTAILLGLDRLDATAKESHRMIWLLSWETERQLSLVLGYPSAVQATAKLPFGTLPMGLEAPVEYHILHSLAVLYGDVINRDQDRGNKSYATTMKIEEDAQEIKAHFPAEWWEPCHPGASVADVYYREGIKHLYFLLVKLIHMPYMLMSVHNTRYEHSRHAALEAAREQIRCYVRLRNHSDAEILMCELMDFQAFNAGITIIIGSLYMPGSAEASLNIFSEDSVLIESLICSLRMIASRLECLVAEQSANVLQLLIDPRRSSEHVELLVPYFGKLQIKAPVSIPETSASVSLTDFELSPVTYPAHGFPMASNPPMVEFSTCEFLKGIPLQFKEGNELRQDWFGVIDQNACYDWQQTWAKMDVDC